MLWKKTFMLIFHNPFVFAMTLILMQTPCLADLFTVTFVSDNPLESAFVTRAGVDLQIDVGMAILDGDYLRTNGQRVQLTDSAGGWFRVGANTDIELATAPFTEEGYALYIDAGEVYTEPSCIKLQSSCWTHNAANVAFPRYHFASLENETIGEFDAVLGDLVEGEYDEFGVFHKDYDIPEGWYLRMTGWPPNQTFELGQISQERLDYISQNYGNDARWVPEPATLVLLGLGGLAMLRRRRG